jgi:pimeloyl-ACP methyl ester carboxylesterase
MNIEEFTLGAVPVLVGYPALSAPVPLVILSHGFTRSKEDWRERIPELVGRGYAVAALDNRGHGSRVGPDFLARASHQGKWDLLEIRRLILETAEDIQTVVDGLLERKRIDDSRIGLAGVSMGAFASLKATVMDSRIRVVVSNIGSPYWDDVFAGSIEESEPARRVVLRNFAEQHQPASFPDRFFPRAVLFQTGTNDPHLDSARVGSFRHILSKAYASAPERMDWVDFQGATHDFLPKMWKNTIHWLDSFL